MQDRFQHSDVDLRAQLEDSLQSLLSHYESRRARPHANISDFDPELWRELAGLGAAGALVPEDHSGLGLGLDIAVTIARKVAPVADQPLVPIAVGAARTLALSGSPIAARLLPAIADGSLMPALAWQEGGASPTDTCRTLAVSDKSGFRLDGEKRFVVPAEKVSGYLVTANAAGTAVIGWLPHDGEAVTASTEPTVDGGGSGVLKLNGARLAPKHIVAVGEQAVAILRRVFDECLVATSAELVGLAETMLSDTLEYLRLRTQFGQPIGSFQAIQHRLADLFVQQELARAVLDEATAEANTGDEVSFSLAAARAKARCSDVALTIGRAAVQLHGAIGFTAEASIGRHLTRALVKAAWLGNSESHRARFPTAVGDTGRDTRGPIASGELKLPVAWDTLDAHMFRRAVREIFESEYPGELRHPPRRLRWKECKAFYKRLGEYGLLAFGWPKEFGGAGLSAEKQIIFMDEQDRWGVARAPDMGITMVGPALIRFGTAEQRDYYLPHILTFEQMWCQGFSEPGSGSDLASLTTQAVREGDYFIINGQKIWTTFAHDATNMFMLARTDKTAKSQLGISLFLLDMSTPGISVRPITDLAGNDEFCEVRFDNVRLPQHSMLGELNQGWNIAKALLSFERIYLGNPRQSKYALTLLEALATDLNLLDDHPFMAKLNRLRADVWDLSTLFGRYAEAVKRGETLGPDVSILKIFGAETYQRISELALEAVGSGGGLSGDVSYGNKLHNVMALFMNARSATIYGGSSEVQRNIVAKDVLKLPQAPRSGRSNGSGSTKAVDWRSS